MADQHEYGRSWGTNPLKQRDETLAVIDGRTAFEPRRQRRQPRPQLVLLAGAAAAAFAAWGVSYGIPGLVRTFWGA